MRKIYLCLVQKCGFFPSAEKLLNDMGINYCKINISLDPKLRLNVIRKANGMQTAPQIYVKKKYLGGFAELYAMQQFCELERLLKE